MSANCRAVCAQSLRGAVVCVALFASSAAYATNHFVQFDEVMAGANGDSTLQFVEIKFLGGQGRWGPPLPGQPARSELAFFDATGAEVGQFEFPNDATEVPGSQDPNTPNMFSSLIATQAFVDATGLAADFIIPPLVVARAGKVCFRDNVSPFTVNLCVSYGSNVAPDIDNGLIPYVGSTEGFGPPTEALPITNAASLARFTDFGCVHLLNPCHGNDDYQLGTPAPRNSTGGTVTIAVSPTLTQGETLFMSESFLGNGRSCATCHAPGDGFGLNPSTIASLPANDLLFVAEFDPALAQLENSCLMRGGRSLILENVHGFAADPVFRTSPHLMNIAMTAPYGWSPSFGGAPDLVNFCAGAVKQHFPKFLPRNFDPAAGPMSQRTGTVEELTLMEEFQNSVKTQVPDGQGDLGGDREQNLDRLIAAFIACTPAADPVEIAAGRTLFTNKGCLGCHTGPFLGSPIELATGVVNHPANADDGCQGGPGDPTLPLPNEDTQCANDPNCTPPMAFVVRPLIDIARVRENFFHAGEAANLTEAVDFYASPAFENSPAGFAMTLSPAETAQIVAFLSALVQVEACGGACCLPDGTCIDDETSTSCEAQCGVFRGAGTTCASLPIGCPITLPGACCLPDGTCVPADGQCVCEDLLGGVFQGPGIACSATLCPQPGACCLPDATCQIIMEEDCLAQCGSFEGGNACPDFCCVDLARACCLPDGSCIEAIPCECELQGGIPQPANSDCATTTCEAPGGCCLPNGSCQIMSQADCDAACGDFQGFGQPCPQFCAIELPSACCLQDGTCTDTSACLCEQQGGTFHSGQQCSTVVCVQPTGACCLPDGSCQPLTAQECDDRCGVYHGDGVACSAVFCLAQAPQACCIGGLCRNLPPAECICIGGRVRTGTCSLQQIRCPIEIDPVEEAQ